MATDSRYREPRWFQVRTVEGGPIAVAGRELTPAARVVSFGKASGMLGTARNGGWGAGFAWIRPVAVLVGSGRDQERVPIPDATAAALLGMAGAAMLMVVLFTAVRVLARRWRRAGDQA